MAAFKAGKKDILIVAMMHESFFMLPPGAW